MLVVVPMVAGLGLTAAAPMAQSADASITPAASVSAAPGPPLVPSVSSKGAKTPNDYSGYYQNVVGTLSLTASVTVPTMKCTNSATWGTQVGLLALADSADPVSGIDEHGGGVEVGCAAVTGAPSYTAALCDPTFPRGCGALADVVLPGDNVDVTVTASGICNPTCSSVTVTVQDTTNPWTESWNGTSQSDFDTFVVAVGASPLANFGKATLSNVTSNGRGFQGRKFNLIDNAGHTLARAGAMTQGRTSFNVKWLRTT